MTIIARRSRARDKYTLARQSSVAPAPTLVQVITEEGSPTCRIATARFAAALLHARLFLLTLGVALTCCGGRAFAQQFVDPTPPAITKLPEMAAPAAKAQTGLKFHAAPRALAAGATTHDWRTFLGPTHNAISTESPLLKEFAKTGPVKVWEVEKGDGYASPAIVGNRVVLFHRLKDQETVECLEAETGKRFWLTAYPTAYKDPYGWNGGPRCPPVSDGEFVYTFGAEGKLHCLKLTTGQVVWKRDIVKEFQKREEFFGIGATPLIEGDLLIVNVGAEGGPCVVAFDKRTGKMVWGAGKKWGASYASPVPADLPFPQPTARAAGTHRSGEGANAPLPQPTTRAAGTLRNGEGAKGSAGRRRVFVFAGGVSRPATGGLLCIDPANGKVDFSFPWRGRRYESVNASSPLIVGSQVFISECYGAGGALLNLMPDGTAKPAWTNNVLSTHFMTAIHKDGYLYGIDGHGPQNAPIVCIELKTGKEMWRAEPEWEETIKTDQGPDKVKLSPGLASMILVDGRCLMMSEYGHLVWLDLNPKAYKEVERTRLFLARENWSMPALSRGLLYVCQNTRGFDDSQPRLICYDLRGEKK